MSTGLTFGTISALFGLSHGVISQAQYSAVVAAVVASAVVPTLIANAFFLPRHLLKKDELAESGNTAAVAPVNTGSVS
jgi:fructose-specific phosphotransferase system IIC component